MYDCDYEIPKNKTIDGYDKLTNVSCSYCSAICEAPKIDSTIGFFDGFKTGMVMTVYSILIAFTIFY